MTAHPTTRTVDNHIASPRAKIEPDPAHPRHLADFSRRRVQTGYLKNERVGARENMPLLPGHWRDNADRRYGYIAGREPGSRRRQLPRKPVRSIGPRALFRLYQYRLRPGLQTGQEYFQKALSKESGRGESPRSDRSLYQKAIEASKDEALKRAGRPACRSGFADEKLGLAGSGKAPSASVVERYPSQNETVKLAKERLERLSAASAIRHRGCRRAQSSASSISPPVCPLAGRKIHRVWPRFMAIYSLMRSILNEKRS